MPTEDLEPRPRRTPIAVLAIVGLLVVGVAWVTLRDDSAGQSATNQTGPPVSIVYLSTVAGRPAKVMLRDLRNGQERTLGDPPTAIVNVEPLIVVSGPYAFVSHSGSLMRYSLTGPPDARDLGRFQNAGVVAVENGLWVARSRRAWRLLDWDGKLVTTVEDTVDDSLPVGAAADGLVLHQGTTGETVFLDSRGLQSLGKVFPVAAGGRHVVFIRDTNLIALDIVNMTEITVAQIGGEIPSSTFSGRISPDGNRVVIPLKTESDYRPTRTLVVDLQTGHTTQLAFTATGPPLEWSGDGHWLVNASSGRVKAMRLEDGNVVEVEAPWLLRGPAAVV